MRKSHTSFTTDGIHYTHTWCSELHSVQGQVRGDGKKQFSPANIQQAKAFITFSHLVFWWREFNWDMTYDGERRRWTLPTLWSSFELVCTTVLCSVCICLWEMWWKRVHCIDLPRESDSFTEEQMYFTYPASFRMRHTSFCTSSLPKILCVGHSRFPSN